LIDNYFDLYTSTNLPMNVYSKHFQGRLGFKDVNAARRSIGVLEAAYRGRVELRSLRTDVNHWQRWQRDATVRQIRRKRCA
jgi:hypothetical protein